MNQANRDIDQMVYSDAQVPQQGGKRQSNRPDFMRQKNAVRNESQQLLPNNISCHDKTQLES